MRSRIPKLFRLVAVMVACFGAAAVLPFEGREVGADLSGCFHECEGLECKFRLTLETQCDEEDIPGAKQCTNFPCGVL